MKDKRVKDIEELAFNQVKINQIRHIDEKEEKFEYDLIKVLKMFNKRN